MRVEYASNRLEKTCTSERELRKALPKDFERVQRRIKALERATDLDNLVATDPTAHWHELQHGDLRGKWAGTVRSNWRVIFVPLEQGGVLVAEVQEIYHDYHGK